MSKLWPLFVLIVAALVVLVSTRFAAAHDWYSSTSDPVFQSSCCGGNDCAPVDPAWVSEVREGYRLTMTVDQARTVNPLAQAPVDAVVPWTRIQSPPNGDHMFYACIYDTDRSAPRHGVICFFATPVM
ncbi:MAG: hypothetical protein ACOZAM_29550 [Pseudomonadota bacterium]